MFNTLIVKRLLLALTLLFSCISYSYSNTLQNKCLIDYAIINNDTIEIDDLNKPIVLNTHDIISFGFHQIADSCVLTPQFQFYLTPAQKPSKIWSTQNFTTYNHLKPGIYSFYLICKNGQVTTIPIIVKKSEHPILFALIITALAVIIFWSVKRKIQQHIISKFTQYKTNLNNQINSIRHASKTEDSVKLTRRTSTKYQQVTILFADIQGFTKIVEHLNPETLIDELDRFFIRFDEVAEKYRIEKIKTIGDAYMCAGGIPDKNRTNPIEVILAALEMQAFMGSVNHETDSKSQDFWAVRIGIHTGPVISGIIGRKKLSFDIWGDSVNIASRMESSGVAGKVNISGVTYELIKDFFDCEYRGKMPIKYKGETDMYFVKGIKPELSVDGNCIEPNTEFNTKLQWIRFNDMEEFVLEQLRNELSSNLRYHDVEHTIDVCTQVEIIGRAESLNNKELLIVKTAALFHDTGFLVNNKNHEEHSKKIAKEVMAKFQFADNDIEDVVHLIDCTKSEVVPISTTEKVLKDADLDYLGRPDFIQLSERLWEEMSYYKGQMSISKWNEHQYNFLTSHQYYTGYAKQLRQVKKENQIKKIMDLLKT